MDFDLNLSTASAEHKAVPVEDGKLYDVIIVGGGPAALTAAVYCMRKGVSTALVTEDIGGQVAVTSSIENYMGYKLIEGYQLVEKFREQVKQFEIGLNEGVRVKGITDNNVKEVMLEDGKSLKAKSLIIATGKNPIKLNVPGEEELVGRGVAYCSICDAPLYNGKRVAVVGGGNSAIESAIDLARVAEHVTVIQILNSLTADEILQKKLNQFSNVDIFYEHEVKKINGTEKVESLVVNNKKDNEESILELHGIFIEIGLKPNSEFAGEILELNKYNEIAVDCSCRTSQPGIFAAGDVTSVQHKQIIIAAGEGAKAALSACDYILKEV